MENCGGKTESQGNHRRDDKETEGLFTELVRIVRRLRGPGGCPWDKEQTFDSMRPHIIEEAYELSEALDSKDPSSISEEDGDLLLQVLFVAVMGEETGDFGLKDVIKAISSKLIRRHPHVFGELKAKDSSEVLKNWEKIKLQEKKDKKGPKGVLSGVPKALPPLLKAFRIQEKAASLGFDWPKGDQGPVFSKIKEETQEVLEALDKGDEMDLPKEIGDLLFSVINLSRRLGIDPGSALEKSNKSFMDRFGYIENSLEEHGKGWEDRDLAELDRLWNEAKKFIP